MLDPAGMQKNFFGNPGGSKATKRGHEMEKEHLDNIKLMRYDCISEALNRTDEDPRSINDIIREASERGVVDRNDGERKYFAVPTILRWYRSYKHSGFDGLGVKERSDIRTFHKIGADVYGCIENLKKQYPRITATAIRKKLICGGVITDGQISLSTVTRCVNRIAAAEEPNAAKDEMRRYERAHINEVWCGDSSTGLYVKIDGVKRKLWMQALIDDASRFIVGIDVFLSDTYENFVRVIKSAVSKYGIPHTFNFDNGSPYKNRQMEMLAARLGSRIYYNKPYTPTAKAKVERFFKTLKTQWMSSFDASKCHSLEDVREELFRYVNQYNNTGHSSLGGKTPQNRFFEEAALIKKLPGALSETAFLYEIQRKVTKDGLVSVNNRLFEVDFGYSGKTVTLRCSPDLQNFYVAEDGLLVPIRLLDKTENSNRKRNVRFSGANPEGGDGASAGGN